ncbi:MAG TPA: Rhs element Vgr protein, partial [bacterium]|nr:Rhs element Vgr protein [bacterium]
MSNGRVVPTPDSSDLPTYRILIDGQEITKKYHLLALTVTKAVNKIPVAKVRLLDGDASKEDFEISNTDFFVPGKSIEILAGYHSEESTLFQGMIIRHGIKSREGRHSILEVECKDEAVKMTVGRKNAYFQDMTDSDIIAEILGQYNLTADVSSTSYQHPEMIQYYSTDWDYLVERADANGLLVI